MIGIRQGGHLNVTDLCHTNPQGKSSVQVAQDNGVCGISNIVALADCGRVNAQKSIEIVNAATTAALEETLHCQDRAAAISDLETRYPDIGEFQEAK